MMKTFFRSLLWIGLLTPGIPALAQEDPADFNEIISKIFSYQRFTFPQEKAYLHFDRNHYISGDTIWFRGHLVDASTHQPDTLSRYLYVSLVNPVDSVVQKLRIRLTNGAYPGYLALPDDTPQGNYTVWAYTLAMLNAGPDYFFQAPIRVTDPLSIRIEEQVNFTRNPGDKHLSTEIRFRDIPAGEYTKPTEMQISLNGIKPDIPLWSPRRNEAYSHTFRNLDTTKRNVLLVDYDKSRRFVEIPPAPHLFDVTFHPEGGYIISDQMNTIGFKALNANGLGENITGEIFNSQNEQVGEFTTDYKGIGFFNLLPPAGERYYAVCTTEAGYSQRFDLPEIRTDVFGLKVIQRNGLLYTQILRPELRKTEPVSIIVQARGQVIYTAEITEDREHLRFDTRSIPSGVTHIMLIDSHWNILNERLVFIQNKDLARVAFSTDRPAYDRRTAVQATVTLTNEQGVPLTGNFSVSVTDDKDLQPDSTRNIYTEILLASELKGYIESPAWYFEDDQIDRIRALDALMLTQGWRRYDIPKLLNKTITEPVYPYEGSMFLSGRVKILASRRFSTGTPVFMVSPTTGLFQMEETDDQGEFLFLGYEVADTASLFVQAVNKRGRAGVELIVDDEPAGLKLPVIPGPVRITPYDLGYIAKAEQKWIMENGMRTIHMGAVEVKGNKSLDRFMESQIRMADYVYDEEYFKDHIITDFQQLLMMLPGVTVMGDQVMIRREPVKFIIDDFPAWDWFDWRSDIIMDDVERVLLFRNAVGTAMHGGPTISIYLKKGGGSGKKAYNRKVVVPLGYQPPAEFYSPKYITPQQRSRNIQDLRTTLYWNPSVRTDENGTATFTFYSADTGNTTYSVVMEGVTDNGQIIRSVEKVVRK